MKKYAIPLMCAGLVAGLLTACNSGDDDYQSPPQVQVPLPAPVVQAPPDPFTAQVAAVVASQPEDTESAALDASAATMPEDTEPQAVQ